MASLKKAHLIQPRFIQLVRDWRASRADRVKLPNDVVKATRDVTGPTGWVTTSTWDRLEAHSKAYVSSFDQRLPPSLHISERDRKRHGLVMPVAERCIEDWDKNHRTQPE